MVKCLVCSEFEEEAKRYAGNNRVYLADGVRCDSKKKLQDIVDHLHYNDSKLLTPAAWSWLL